VWAIGNPTEVYDAIENVYLDGVNVGQIISEYSVDENEMTFHPVGDTLPPWIVEAYLSETDSDVPPVHGYTFG
jgi:hypothetical protein